MRAAEEGHMEILKLLACHTDLELISGYCWTLLHHATEGGPDVFSYLLMQACSPFAENYAKKIPVELALYRNNAFPSFVSLKFNLDLDLSTWKGVISHSKARWDSCCKAMIRFFLRRAPSDTVCHELEATTWTKGSVLEDAAVDGQADIAELFVLAGANLDLDRGPHGTPLLNACTFGRLSVVKYLVRAGARTVGTRGGRPYSALEAARYFPDVIRWLLVERHLEQPRIEYCPGGIEGQGVCAWSGMQSVRVEIAGMYSQDSEGSSFDHAKELAKLRRDLQGEVVYVFEETEEKNADR